MTHGLSILLAFFVCLLPRSYAHAPRLNRLTKEIFTNSSGASEGYLSYDYDQAGNRTNRVVSLNFSPYDSLTNKTFAFDHRDLIDSDAVPNNANPNYDANGNTLIDCANTTGDLYDAENHLVYAGVGAFGMAYDAEGNRVNKNFGGGTITYYLVDEMNPTGYAQVLAEYTSLSSAPSVGYSYGLGLISEKASGGSVLYCGYDGQGSVRMLVNGNTVEDTYDYDGYGNILAHSGTDNNNYRYCGQQWDPYLGQYYLRARYYAPKLGRFWTMDTYQGFKQHPASLHKYLYCEADPIDRTDPSGRASTTSAQIGQAVHKYIGDDFTGSGAIITRFSGPSVVNILREAGIPITPAAADVVTALFPDLTDTGTKEVYEIKPDNVRSIALGEAQLWAYIDLFNYLDPTGGWHPGTNYKPPFAFTIGLNQITAVGSPPSPPGMILYHVLNIQQFAQKQAVRAGASENAELGDDVGIASLDSVLGGF